MAKLVSSDNSDLMEVQQLRIDGANLIIIGKIMGAMPIEALLTPTELRKMFRLMNIRLAVSILKMLVSR